jgi:glycosidase
MICNMPRCPLSHLLPGLILACQTEPGGEDSATPESSACALSLSHSTDQELDAVGLVGDFNDWDENAHPMKEVDSGLWSTTIRLEPGSYSYRFSEQINWSTKGYENRICDPAAEYLICEDGTMAWPEDGAICASGQDSLCSSLLIVEDCSLPQLQLLWLDSSGDSLVAEIGWVSGTSDRPMESMSVSLDGVDLSTSEPETGNAELIFESNRVRVELSELDPAHHELRIEARDSEGLEAEPLVHRFWSDDHDDWRQGTIYFAFVDRLSNGETSLDSSEGATHQAGDYQGGDWAGVEAALPYLSDLGIETLWLSNPQSNADGSWSGDCGESYTGYHAYWPDAQTELESHFGDEAALDSLIDAAHDKGMRVIMDWVGNHVHTEHPLYETQDWFSSQAICEDSVSGETNWDRIPETCWFAPYLPDLDYSKPEVMELMLDDAMHWAQRFHFDGFRVDAVKHMPHSVSWNLERRIQADLEHRAAGGMDSFWTLGETFDGRSRIAEYLSSEDRPQLDGQFDFPLYYALLDSLAWSNTSLAELEAALSESDAAYGDGVMANFLGNHDTGRFATLAAGQGDQSCLNDSELIQATPPEDSDAYARMRLAWTFLFTQSQAPLIYYGDELGMPGFGDPDNRQALWNHGLDLSTAPSLEEAMGQLEGEPAAMLAHVAALSQARQAYPQIWRGESQQWWMSPTEWPETWAWTRLDPQTGKGSIVILNISSETVLLENSLAWSGLPGEGSYTDLLDGSRFEATSDWVSISVPPMSSRLLLSP